MGLEWVIAWDPGVPAEDEGGSFPECLALLPLGQRQLAIGAYRQEVVWPVSCLKGNSWRVWVKKKKKIHKYKEKLAKQKSYCDYVF